MADVYDLLRFAIRGHGAVRIRLLRAAECLTKGNPSPEPIEALMNEFDEVHRRLLGMLAVGARRGRLRHR
ncbi:MAG: hypothetical protein ABI277_03605 [Burkholderiaceae bacterium]